MKKTEFVGMVAEQAGVTKKEAEYLIDVTFRCLADVLAEDGRISLHGFGAFECRQRAARETRVPLTDKVVSVPASRVPVFKPSKQLKEKLNQS